MINIKYECAHCAKDSITQFDIEGDQMNQYAMLQDVECSNCRKLNEIDLSISINIESVSAVTSEMELQNDL